MSSNSIFSVLLNRKQLTTTNATVRKASSLTDVRELQLDYGARHHVVHNNLGTEELVKLGRDHYVECFGDRAFYYRGWPDSLSSALDRAGFIRHDINRRTFLVGRLYRRIYVMSGKDTSRIFTSYDEITSNSHYEACQIVTDESFYNLMEYLDIVLGKREARIIKLLFGFEDGQPQTYGEIAKAYNINGQRVRQLAKRYLGKLAESGLPPLKYPSL